MTLLLLLACTGSDDSPKGGDDTGASTPTDSTPTGTTPAAGVCTPLDGTLPDPEVVSLETADGVTLAADWYGHAPEAPVLVLLHMIPPTYDRTSWPVDVIEGFRSDGCAVIAIDRRGAGESGGDAQDAYRGPLGVNDAFAAVDLALARGHERVAVIGASNGTTTLLDYAIEATAAGYPEPEALVLLSGGTYTEANHDMEELFLSPTLFAYPRDEADWNETQAALGREGWAFWDFAIGDHGTFMFDAREQFADELRGWLRGEETAP